MGIKGHPHSAAGNEKRTFARDESFRRLGEGLEFSNWYQRFCSVFGA